MSSPAVLDKLVAQIVGLNVNFTEHIIERLPQDTSQQEVLGVLTGMLLASNLFVSMNAEHATAYRGLLEKFKEELPVSDHGIIDAVYEALMATMTAFAALNPLPVTQDSPTSGSRRRKTRP